MASDNPLTHHSKAAEERILDRIRRGERIARNLEEIHSDRLHGGERLAGFISRVIGSWTFVLLLFVAAFVWVLLNSIQVVFRTWDPQSIQNLHYLILNGLLYFVVGVQIPVLLMRQKRLEDRERLRAEHEFESTLKQELEMEGLHFKLDVLDLRPAVLPRPDGGLDHRTADPEALTRVEAKLDRLLAALERSQNVAP